MKSALVLLALTGCSSVGLQGQLVRIEPGPGFGREVSSIASLSATCGVMGSATHPALPAECSDAMMARVDRATLGFLEARDVRTVRSRSLNAATFEKLKAQRRESDQGAPDEWGGARVLFRSASPVLQSQVLEEMNVDGILRTRLLVGAGVGMSQRRSLTAVITLFDREGTLVWASRCEREVGLSLSEGGGAFTAADLLETAMCALEEAASL
ncbi:MAG: hypothetical protein AB8H86_21640 [Polyangiales bacterium]